MVPMPLALMKGPGGKSNSMAGVVVMWITAFSFLVPCMVAVGVVRVVAPWTRSDCEKYLRRLGTLLDSATAAAVSARAPLATLAPAQRTRGRKPDAPRSPRRAPRATTPR